MKAIFISILLLIAADFGLNHGAVSKRVFGGITHLITSTGEATSDSVFSK